MEKKEMKEVIEWSVNVKWNGEWRNGPARSTMDAALQDAQAFMKKMNGKFLPVTFVRTIKYEAV